MRVPNCSPVLDKNCAPMGPEILSSTGAGVGRKAPKAFPDSSSVLDTFQSATKALLFCRGGGYQQQSESVLQACMDMKNWLELAPSASHRH